MMLLSDSFDFNACMGVCTGAFRKTLDPGLFGALDLFFRKYSKHMASDTICAAAKRLNPGSIEENVAMGGLFPKMMSLQEYLLVVYISRKIRDAGPNLPEGQKGRAALNAARDAKCIGTRFPNAEDFIAWSRRQSFSCPVRYSNAYSFRIRRRDAGSFSLLSRTMLERCAMGRDFMAEAAAELAIENVALISKKDKAGMLAAIRTAHKVMGSCPAKLEELEEALQSDDPA